MKVELVALGADKDVDDFRLCEAGRLLASTRSDRIRFHYFDVDPIRSVFELLGSDMDLLSRAAVWGGVVMLACALRSGRGSAEMIRVSAKLEAA